MSTTTIRLPIELRDEIARLADQRDSSMVGVVSDAVGRLARDEWWDRVHAALDSLSEEDAVDYMAETDRLDGTTSDGIT